jgi:protoporphyrinogen IX oxidase
MVGMLYLPRLFVYHVEAPQGSPQTRIFVVMERRLMRAIMLPALLVTWITGLTLAVQTGFLHEGWFHAKFALVIALSALHGYFAKVRRDLAGEANRHGSRFFRIMNEAPTVLMVGIVILVVFKPF